MTSLKLPQAYSVATGNSALTKRTGDLSRRGLLGAIICAPAIVRASSLMAVKVLPTEWCGLKAMWGGGFVVYEDLITALDARLLVSGHFLEGDYPLREQFLRRAHA